VTGFSPVVNAADIASTVWLQELVQTLKTRKPSGSFLYENRVVARLYCGVLGSRPEACTEILLRASKEAETSFAAFKTYWC